MSTCTYPHVVVTGASSGIGRATVLELAASGHHVYAAVRKTADGTALVSAAGACAGEVSPVLLDVTDAARVAAAAETVAGHVGPAGLDALVNNAGIGVFGPLEIIPVQDLRRVLEVNVTAQVAVTQAFLPLLRAAGGRIVMIGSIGHRFTPPFTGPLAASKSAVATLCEALRQELAPWNIRVVLIEPASIRTDAVTKLDQDARQVLGQASDVGRDLYADSFDRMVSAFGEMHVKGSPPEVAARAVARALAARHPRACYLTGRNSRRMAFMARALPIRAQDAVRRAITHQPVPGSRVGSL